MRPRRRGRAWRLGLLLLGGCGARSVEDLALPRLEMVQRSGFCSNAVVVDGDQHVWRESGCEADSSGWQRLGHVTVEARGQLEALFDAAAGLPAVDCHAEADGQPSTWIGERAPLDPAQAEQEFVGCSDDTRSLPPEQQTFVDVMRSLTR